jgi:hypothetical protein
MKKMLIVAILSMMTNAEAFTVNEIKRTPIDWQDQYMLGLMDGVIAMGYLCGGETYGQDVAVLKKYIANNPAEWGDTVGAVYIRAITQAYHCGDSQNKRPALYRRSIPEVRW